jgi:hypothetical protein
MSEAHLFFGREGQIDTMVDQLATTRFLAVVGSSGCGKSSLVNCGLRPALHRGLMASTGPHWRVVQFRPGSAPLAALASALAQPDVLFEKRPAAEVPIEFLVESTLRLSKLGLVDIFQQAHLPRGTNLLVVVDQFEELFRFPGHRHNGGATGPGSDAKAFVKLLLEVPKQRCPIYVVLTMRSDFLGDCAAFNNLPEAINRAQYLVPRLTRDERRAAIAGPARLGGSEIAPVLLTRLLNDVGDDPDQLSVLQHALNRTWAQWRSEGSGGEVELSHYEKIGTMTLALDRHAEEVYATLERASQRRACKKIFQALTDTVSDPRGVRRPTTLGDLYALTGARPETVDRIVETFRSQDCSFLAPALPRRLDETTVVDIAHESLMRVWRRLKAWADEEAHAAELYQRLNHDAQLHSRKEKSLWRDPELTTALRWRDTNQPTEAWANQYAPGFADTMSFLKRSAAERRAQWVRRFRWAAVVALLLVALPVVVIVCNHKEVKDALDTAETALTTARKGEAEARRALEIEQKHKEAMEENLQSAKESRHHETLNFSQIILDLSNDINKSNSLIDKVRRNYNSLILEFRSMQTVSPRQTTVAETEEETPEAALPPPELESTSFSRQSSKLATLKDPALLPL